VIELELEEFVKQVQDGQVDRQRLEILPARRGCPTHLYDTLSAFSNQDSGGIILFGLESDNDFGGVGVYDAEDLRKKVIEQCQQMEPVVEPLFTIWKSKNGCFVSAEIPALDSARRPCYYRGLGKSSGAYVRVGHKNERMPAYQIYNYEMFSKNYRDDGRINYGADMEAIRWDALDSCMRAIRDMNPQLAQIPEKELRRFLGMTADGKPTLACTLLFSVYPQRFYPMYVVEIHVMRETEHAGDPCAREFSDCAKLEGTIPEMLDGVLRFLRDRVRTKTIVDPKTKCRTERYEYPMEVLREAVLNALVHRDYSIYTQAMPVRVMIFKDRIEIWNPGGECSASEFSDTRNPILARFLEAMNIMKNRRSGMRTMQQELENAGMRQAVFSDSGNGFCVTIYGGEYGTGSARPGSDSVVEEKLLEFCESPKSRQEIAEFLGMTTIFYVSNHYINPLVEKGKLRMMIPGHPKSKKQKFFRA